MALAAGWEEVIGSRLNGCRISAGDGDEALEMDGGDGLQQCDVLNATELYT